MCFSATASFVATGVIAPIGVLTLKQVKKKSEISLASMPLIFAIQQAVEGVVWLSFNIPWLNSAATILYMFFAYVFWLVFIPFALLLVETKSTSKKFLKGFLLCGALTSAYLLFNILTTSVYSRIVDNSIEYVITLPDYSFIAFSYIFSVCGSCFASSHKMLKILGAGFLLSFVLSYYFYTFVFASVWCFLAALLSAIIYFHFRGLKRINSRR